VSAGNARAPSHPLPGQVVLVLQGGGALGAYQAGVYEALHEAGIEPDWVIGTSIGAINGALVAGNPPARRLARLLEFWQRVHSEAPAAALPVPGLGHNALANLGTLATGIDGFFVPGLAMLAGVHAPLGPHHAAFYDTAPLRRTLAELIDFDYLAAEGPRLSVGAVKVTTGEMVYFDSRETTLGPEHVMASGALPPAFPAVEVAGELYWDGGVYSNTPIEAVFRDRPRRDAVVFAVQLWNPGGDPPRSVWEALGRHKEIQYASRAASHIREQRELHRLRHIIRELEKHLPQAARDDPQLAELCAFGCTTQMHIVRLLAPRMGNEDHTKDIDFTARGIATRHTAGLEDTRRWIAAAPWREPVDPRDGVRIHEHPAIAGARAGP